jgi:hypothetical protein
MLSMKKKNTELITIFPPSPLQHDQHYGNLMFTFSIAQINTDANINIYFNQVECKLQQNPNLYLGLFTIGVSKRNV